MFSRELSDTFNYVSLAELKAGGPDVSGLVLGTGPGLGGVGGLRLGSDMSMFLCWAWTWSRACCSHLSAYTGL